MQVALHSALKLSHWQDGRKSIKELVLWKTG